MHLHESNNAEQDWKSLRPYFGWQSEQVIQDTSKVTSSFGGPIHNHDYCKNISNHEILVSISPGGMSLLPQTSSSVEEPLSQFFVSKDTLVRDAYGLNTLYDIIKSRGAMNTIIADGGKYEISKKVADLLRSLFIKQYESEPYHQHQNKAQQCYGVVKRCINTLMNLTGARAHCWLLLCLCMSAAS